MMISRECDYAIRVMRALADRETKTVKTICEAEHIPQQFAYKILKKLEGAALVVGLRGPAGGYKMTADPDEVTLWDVISAIDEVSINECFSGKAECPLNSGGRHCKVHGEFLRIQDILQSALSEKKLSELI